MYTVKKLATLAGVSGRTLHYYDEIGLLKPSTIGANGYRYYTDEALFRLQQIMFYREMDIELAQIKEILDDPQFDLLTALQAHRETLTIKVGRLQTLIQTIDTTMSHLTGEVTMSKKNIFDGFSKEKQEQYQQEAMQKYGEDQVKPSVQRWNSYSPERQDQIKQEGHDIYTGIANEMDKGAHSAEVQTLLGQWHQHLRHFYEPSLDRLRGLGELYHDSPDFNATFTAIHPDLPAFLQTAIHHYVDTLEAKALS